MRPKLRSPSLLPTLILAASLPGCQPTQSSNPTVRTQLTTQQRESIPEQLSPSSPTSQPTPRPIALVNDRPIDRREFLDLLIQSRGLPLLQQMILRDLAIHETARLGLSVSTADLDREYDLTLAAEQYDGKDIEHLTPARREILVADWCRSRGISPDELAVAMKRQAHLRKIADQSIHITDEMLHDEFARAYGEKVEVRHLQLAAPRQWPEIKTRLDRGEEFAKLVREFSQNILSREKDGLLPPFAANDTTVPAAFIQAAFALQPGQFSNPIETEGSYHVLKLERRIPAESVPFDSRHDLLERRLRARIASQEMQRLGQELLAKARLSILDPTMRRQYESGRASNEITGPPLLDPPPSRDPR